MDTQSVSKAIDQANQAKAQQTNDTIVGVIAVVFILFVIIIFTAVFAKIIVQRGNKCSKCGNWKNNKPAMQSIKSGETTTTKKVLVCAKCGHEY